MFWIGWDVSHNICRDILFLRYFIASAKWISSLTRKGCWPVTNWKIRNNGSKEKNQFGRSRKSAGIIRRRLHTTWNCCSRGLYSKQCQWNPQEEETHKNKLMVRKSKSNRYKTAQKIKAEMLIEHGVNIAVSTTQRRLREAGL